MMPMSQEHDRNSSLHKDDAISAADIRPAEPAVENQPSAQVIPPAASFAELTGQPAVEPAAAKAEPPLANTDAVIEQLAHGMVDKELDGRDEQFLKVNGYDAVPPIRGAHEFVMRTFVPIQAGKAPIVAFRGTVPTKAQTVIADLDPTGIGMYQFNPNRARIESEMQAASSHGAVISAGHSLGGALAQIAAATFPSLVSRIVTFQAPGVSAAMAKKLADHNAADPDHAIDSSHHRVKGDLVPYGGEALTPGTIHNHQMTGGNFMQRNPLSKHTSLPLAQEEIAAGHDVPVHGDRGMIHTGDISTEQDNAEKTQLFEKARTGLGHLVYGVGSVFSH